MDSIKEKEINDHWEKRRTIDKDRTSFGRSSLIQLATTIIPYLLIWIFVSQDFKQYETNIFLDLPLNHIFILFLLLLGWMIISIATNISFFYFGIQKSDCIIYTLALSGLCSSLILNGAWTTNLIEKISFQIIIRFIISLFIAFFMILIGTYCSIFLKNNKYKYEENEYRLLISYKNGETIPENKIKKIQNLIEIENREKKELEQLDIFKQSLQDRVKKDTK